MRRSSWPRACPRPRYGRRGSGGLSRSPCRWVWGWPGAAAVGAAWRGSWTGAQPSVWERAACWAATQPLLQANNWETGCPRRAGRATSPACCAPSRAALFVRRWMASTGCTRSVGWGAGWKSKCECRVACGTFSYMGLGGREWVQPLTLAAFEGGWVQAGAVAQLQPRFTMRPSPPTPSRRWTHCGTPRRASRAPPPARW